MVLTEEGSVLDTHGETFDWRALAAVQKSPLDAGRGQCLRQYSESALEFLAQERDL